MQLKPPYQWQIEFDDVIVDMDVFWCLRGITRVRIGQINRSHRFFEGFVGCPTTIAYRCLLEDS